MWCVAPCVLSCKVSNKYSFVEFEVPCFYIQATQICLKLKMACAVNAASSGDVDMDINVEEISVVHFEEGTDIYIKTEEIPGDITFPKIKAEEDESCTNSPKVVAGLCNERRATSSGDLHTGVSVEVEEVTDMDIKVEAISVVKVEEDTDTDIKEEEIPVVKFEEESAIDIKEEEISGGGTFPTINGEEDQSTLNEGQHVHDVGRPGPSDVCNTTLRQQSTLQRPQVLYRHWYLYACDVCNKSCKDENDLMIHQRIHSGERPYACDGCNKSFKVQSALKRHQRIFCGEDPYTCDVCNKSCRNQSNLKRHQRIHSGERPYACDVCKKSFKVQSTLKIHQRIYCGERPYT